MGFLWLLLGKIMQKRLYKSGYIAFILSIFNFIFYYSDVPCPYLFSYCCFPYKDCRWHNVVKDCCIASTVTESMDGCGCLEAVFSSTRKVNLSIGRLKKKRYFVLSRISLVNGSFIDYATVLESNINFGMGLK